MSIPGILMTQTCTIKPFQGNTPSGIKYGPEVNTKCRFEEKRKKYVNASGKEYISSGILFLNPTINTLSVDIDSKVTIDNVEYTITERSPRSGFKLHHIECVVV